VPLSSCIGTSEILKAILVLKLISLAHEFPTPLCGRMGAKILSMITICYPSNDSVIELMPILWVSVKIEAHGNGKMEEYIPVL